MKAWYLIYTKPKQEDVALANLERQGFQSYLPKVIGLKRKQGRSIKTVLPMFPRYLFIYLDNQTDNWGPIRSTIGVANMVRFGMEAARVPEQLVQEIRARENADGVVALPDKAFEKGQTVRITTGPFEGYEAIFSDRQAKNRVLVLLKIAENFVNVKLDQHEIESI
ncbi:MAG: transcription/translation regulatory transformer protein RfaH [Gammaproteobacteria bacterium]